MRTVAGALGLVVLLCACGRSQLLGYDPGEGGGGAGGGGSGGAGGGGSGGAGGEGGVIPPDCGDGDLDPGESCDDGNASSEDGCTVFCLPNVCGDGFVFQGVEACDDGNTKSGDGCQVDCSLPACGDGVTDPGEACDDGNASNEDACLVGCVKNTCGDGFQNVGVEGCDDGNLLDGDGCQADCSLPGCGDGVLDPGEACDDGNASNVDACLVGCVLATCGDGFVHAGVEGCDDGNASNTDGCLVSCAPASCGDGFVHAGVEQCDDGNQTSGDGCQASCQLPVCGDGVLDPGEICDDGNASTSDACVFCAPATCGDGFVHAGFEACDDGNLLPGDGCSPTCELPVCGDGVVEGSEACDLGAANADVPAVEVSQGAQSFAVVVLRKNQSGVLFYNYFSASSHTGLEAVGASRLFFYQNAANGVLSLFTHHGIDLDATGLDQPSASVDMNLAGLPAGTFISVVDDSFQEFGPTGPGVVVGNWTFNHNSDGGVVSGFPVPGSWQVTVDATFSPAIGTWSFVQGPLAAPTFVTLAQGQPVVITANDTPSACRADCTVPACGDGVWDAGEFCDDGNLTPGDGCNPTCSGV